MLHHPLDSLVVDVTLPADNLQSAVFCFLDMIFASCIKGVVRVNR